MPRSRCIKHSAAGCILLAVDLLVISFRVGFSDNNGGGDLVYSSGMFECLREMLWIPLPSVTDLFFCVLVSR